MPSRARNRKNTCGKESHALAKAARKAPRQKHLLVDGYNLVHSHAELKKYIVHFGTEAAREEFYKAVSVLHDFDGWRLTIVWDGQGSAMSVEYPFKVETFGGVFSPGGISADEVIQGLAESCAARDDLVVATSDGGIRVFIQANGARWLSPEEFWRWVDTANESVKRAIFLKK